jgi:4-amino-4-deoxy-L-arabinose transferase-like glycosyltransferase
LSLSTRNLVVGLTLVVSAVLRLWHLSFELGPARNFDERYSFANVRSARNWGALRPANAYYLGGTWIPVALTLRVAEAALEPFDQASLVRYDRERRRFPPLAYFIARLYAALCGTLAILGVALLARRLFGDLEAVLAALFLAGSWAALSYSAQFKPDAILLSGTAATFLLLHAALERPSWKRWIALGLLLGFCLGTKFNAAPLALPVGAAIVAWGALERRGRRETLLSLMLTAAVALGTFLILNPYLSILWRSYHELKAQYRGRGFDPPTQSLREGVAFFVDPAMHGWLIGGLALLGLALLGGRVLRPQDGVSVGQRLTTAALVGFFPIYLLVYALAAGHAKKNNFLLLLVSTSIAAAWLTARLVERSPRRFGRPLVLAIVLAAFCGRVLPLAFAVRDARTSPIGREAPAEPEGLPQDPP